MKNALKRTLSVMLVFMMVVSCFSGTAAFAAGSDKEGFGSTVTMTDASGTDTSDTDVSDTDVSDTDVSDTDVSDTDVSDTDVSDTDVSDTDVSDTDVSDTDVSGTDVSGSDTSGSDVSGSDVRKITSVTIDSGNEKKDTVNCLGGSFKAEIKGENLFYKIALFQDKTRVGSIAQIGKEDKNVKSTTIPEGIYNLPANTTDKQIEYALYVFDVKTESKDIVPEKGVKVASVYVAAKTDWLEIDPETYSFTKEGGSFELVLRYNCSVTYTIKDKSWLTVAQVLDDKGAPVTKDGGVVIKITAAANSGLVRENEVVFSTSNKNVADYKPYQVTLSITQDGVKNVDRLKGDERVATSVAISNEGWTKADTVILASGVNFADALAAAPLAAAADAPILLTMNKTDGLEKIVLYEIARLGAKKVYILGGTSAVSAKIESAITTADCAVSRLAGDTRYGTAVKVAEELSKLTGKEFTKLYFANAWKFPDALAISSVAAIEGNPILYMPTTGEIESVTSKFVSDSKCKTGVILGGTASVSAEGQSSLTKLGLTVSRVSGDDRYETAAEIVKKYDSLFTSNKIAVATGVNFPDALAGGALCAKIKAPVVLVSDKNYEDALAYIKSEAPESLIIFGGPATVSEDLAVKMAAGIKQAEASK